MCFARGDWVRLTSGGPIMSVFFHDTYHDKVEVCWFAGDLLHEATFSADMLMPWFGE